MSDEKIKRMPISEFHKKGYLQEVNRKFLHPLGLALEIVVDPDGRCRLGGVWDYRDDPEGMNFIIQKEEVSDFREKAARVEREWVEKEQTRIMELGYMVQPIR